MSVFKQREKLHRREQTTLVLAVMLVSLVGGAGCAVLPSSSSTVEAVSEPAGGAGSYLLTATNTGLTHKQISQRYAEIEAFAEIGDFINRPVKTYSSGMVVRLAFAVAINVDPEVLLVDEALAVGDASFRHRCMRKVHELRDRGITIVFVSHAIADVEAIGDHVLWLEHGRAMASGTTDVVLPLYLAAMTERAGPDLTSRSEERRVGKEGRSR